MLIHGGCAMIYVIHNQDLCDGGYYFVQLFLARHYDLQHITIVENLKNPQRQKDHWIENKPTHLFCWKEEKAFESFAIGGVQRVTILELLLGLAKFPPYTPFFH